MTKYLIYFYLILVLGSCSRTKPSEEIILSTLNEHYTSFSAKDWNKYLDTYHPKMFEIENRDSTLISLQEFDDPAITMLMNVMQLDSVSEPVDYNSSLVVKVDFTLKNVLTIDDISFYSNAGLMLESFKMQYQTDNVKYDPENKSFTIISNDWLLLIYKNDDHNIKILDVRGVENDKLNMLLSNTTLEKLKI